MISVADTGIGIKGESLKKVFEPFRQEDSSIARKHKGTGLGLSLSRRLVELHGGIIWAESEVGKGSTFSFILPLGEEPAGITRVERSCLGEGSENA